MQDSQRGGFRSAQPPMNYGSGGFNDFGLPKAPVGGPGAIGFPSNRGPPQGAGPQPVNGGRTNAPSGSKETVYSVRLEGIPQEPKMDFLDHVIKTFKLRVTNAALKQNRQTNLYYAILNCDHEDAVRNCFQMLNGRSIQFGNSMYTTTVVLPDSMQSSAQPIASAGPGPQGPRGQQYSGAPNGQSRFNGGAGGPPGGPRGGGFGGSQSARPFQQPFQNASAPRGRGGPPGFTNQDARASFRTEVSLCSIPLCYEKSTLFSTLDLSLNCYLRLVCSPSRDKCSLAHICPCPRGLHFLFRNLLSSASIVSHTCLCLCLVQEQQYQQQQQPPQQQWGPAAGAGGPGFRRPPGGGGGRYGEYESVQQSANTVPEPGGGRGYRGGGVGGPPQQQWGGGGVQQSRSAARDDTFVDTRRRNLSSSGGAGTGFYGTLCFLWHQTPDFDSLSFA